MVSTAGGRRLSDEELDIVLTETEGSKSSEVRNTPPLARRWTKLYSRAQRAEKGRLQVCVPFKSNVHLEKERKSVKSAFLSPAKEEIR